MFYIVTVSGSQNRYQAVGGDGSADSPGHLNTGVIQDYFNQHSSSSKL